LPKAFKTIRHYENLSSHRCVNWRVKFSRMLPRENGWAVTDNPQHCSAFIFSSNGPWRVLAPHGQFEPECEENTFLSKRR